MNLKLVLGKAFLSMCLVWLQLLPSRHYTEWVPAYGKKTYYKGYHHKGYHHSAALGKKNFNLQRSPIVLLIFPDTTFRRSLNFN